MSLKAKAKIVFRRIRGKIVPIKLKQAERLYQKASAERNVYKKVGQAHFLKSRVKRARAKALKKARRYKNPKFQQRSKSLWRRLQVIGRSEKRLQVRAQSSFSRAAVARLSRYKLRKQRKRYRIGIITGLSGVGAYKYAKEKRK